MKRCQRCRGPNDRRLDPICGRCRGKTAARSLSALDQLIEEVRHRRPRGGHVGKLWTPEETEPFVTGWRPAVLVSWYDADTPKVEIELGFGCKTRPGDKGYVRLISENAVLTPDDRSDDVVDAWELRGSERTLGKAAKARAMELIPAGSTVRVWSFKGKGETGKYGRWLLVILYEVTVAGRTAWRSLAETLLEEGHAEASL